MGNQQDDFNRDRAELFEALGHPTRIKILEALSESQLSFSDLRRKVGIESNGLLSFHLGKLDGLVNSSQEGSYLLTDDGREAIRILSSATTSKESLRENIFEYDKQKQIFNLLIMFGMFALLVSLFLPWLYFYYGLSDMASIINAIVNVQSLFFYTTYEKLYQVISAPVTAVIILFPLMSAFGLLSFKFKRYTLFAGGLAVLINIVWFAGIGMQTIPGVLSLNAMSTIDLRGPIAMLTSGTIFLVAFFGPNRKIVRLKSLINLNIEGNRPQKYVPSKIPHSRKEITIALSLFTMALVIGIFCFSVPIQQQAINNGYGGFSANESSEGWNFFVPYSAQDCIFSYSYTFTSNGNGTTLSYNYTIDPNLNGTSLSIIWVGRGELYSSSNSFGNITLNLFPGQEYDLKIINSVSEHVTLTYIESVRFTKPLLG